MASRAGLLARLRRLERPRRSRDALRRELEHLERLHPPTRPDFDSMTNGQLDDFFREMRDDRSPWKRIFELREALKTPAERAEDERRRAQFEGMTDAQLDDWFAEHCRTAG